MKADKVTYYYNRSGLFSWLDEIAIKKERVKLASLPLHLYIYIYMASYVVKERSCEIYTFVGVNVSVHSRHRKKRRTARIKSCYLFIKINAVPRST